MIEVKVDLFDRQFYISKIAKFCDHGKGNFLSYRDFVRKSTLLIANNTNIYKYNRPIDPS